MRRTILLVDDNLKEPIVSSDWHSNYCINELKRLPNYPKQTNCSAAAVQIRVRIFA